MRFAALCASHAPLVRQRPAGAKGAAYVKAMERAGEWVRSFAPDLVIEFFPDHFNGFFYDSMPNFCIGLKAESVGDWGTAKGDVLTPTEDALAMVEALRHADIDVDASHQMQVDHGFTQVLELMLGGFDLYPTIPVMVNCAAPPRPPFRRVRLLGEAVGRFAAELGKRVLFVGSGGLSHDPPIPSLSSASEEQKAFLISGRNPSPVVRAAREGRVLAAAAAFAEGSGVSLAPDEAWDRRFLDLLQSGDLAEIDGWREDAVTAEGGCGGHEVRTWIAAFAALQAAAGRYMFEPLHYGIVPEWMTGMGVARGLGAGGA